MGYYAYAALLVYELAKHCCWQIAIHWQTVPGRHYSMQPQDTHARSTKCVLVTLTCKALGAVLQHGHLVV